LAADNLSELGSLSDHSMAVNSVVWCSRSHIIATAGADHRIFLYNPNTLRKLGELAGHTDSVICITCDQVNQFLISLSKDESIRIWEIRYFILFSLFCLFLLFFKRVTTMFANRYFMGFCFKITN
jgi:WD40 repeat protein